MPATSITDHTDRLRAGRVSVALGVLIFAGKLVAWGLTGSAAVLSDALESTVNVVAALVLLWSLVVASRPADRSHPYGHGKVEFFSAGVEGTLIAVAAVLILSAAVRDLWIGPSLRRIDLGLVLVTVLTALNLALGLYLVRVGRRTGSLAIRADGHHVITDVWTSLGVIGGLLAVRITGIERLDPIVAIGVAINILRTGWRLVREAVAGLMDEADEALLSRMVNGLEAQRAPEWIDVHSLRTFRSGAVYHADLHLVVPRYLDVERLHAIDDSVHEALEAVDGWHGETIVHFDPCRPAHCEGCQVESCPVRTAASKRRAPLSFERATREDDPLDAPRVRTSRATDA